MCYVTKIDISQPNRQILLDSFQCLRECSAENNRINAVAKSHLHSPLSSDELVVIHNVLQNITRNTQNLQASRSIIHCVSAKRCHFILYIAAAHKLLFCSYWSKF